MPDLPPAETPRRIGPYEVMYEVGRGGMGAVYRARDTRLGRTVALKVLLGGAWVSPDAVERFQREASLVARMGKHPHVVQVHDFGREGDIHYFTMDYIEGRSLRAWISERRPVRDVLTLGRKVALGLAHAHANGIVHRDLKPENILVDAAGEPQVTDFGLARDVGATVQFSVSGTILGTPAYMAPEQAAGQASRIGPWTDVHALGVLLYEGITGRTPYGTFDIASTIRRVISDDPPPLRVEVPRDVETILARCLEKDPERRYRDGAEVAEELARFLDGEAIHARPASFADRVLRRVRRNPLVSALSAVALAAALVTVGVSWKAGRDVEAADARALREQARAKEDGLKYLAEGGSDLLDAALAHRVAGDFEGCLERTSRLRVKVDTLKTLAPDLAEPWYYEGRIERVLELDDAAIAALGRAVELATRPGATEGSRRVRAPALYHRGVLRAEAYHRRLQTRRLEMLRAESAAHPDATGAPRRPETAEVLASSPDLAAARKAAIADLREAVGGLDAAAGGAAGAIVAILEGRPEEGCAALEAAVLANPGLEEAYAHLAGDAVSRGDYEAATAWFARGHEADRGCLAHLLGWASTEQEWASHAREEAGWRASLDRAASAAKEATRLCPGSSEAWTVRANVEAARVELLREHGMDLSTAAAEARDAAEHALACDPRSAVALTALACVEQDAAHNRIHEGVDPSKDLEHVRALFDQARALLPGDPLAICNLAVVERAQAEWLTTIGEDPGEAYRRAASLYEEALRAAPLYVEAACWLGEVHSNHGEWLIEAARDPQPEFKAAREAFQRARETRPGHGPTYVGLARLLLRMAQYDVQGGADPRTAYVPTLDYCRRAEEALPLSPEVARVRLLALRTVAEDFLDAGADPERYLESAAQAAEAAVKLGGPTPDLIAEQAWVHLQRARWLDLRGEDPFAETAQAREGLTRALDARPSLSEGWNNLGWACLLEATWRLDRGQDPSAGLAAAAEAADRALALRPRLIASMLARGQIHAVRAKFAQARDEDPSMELGRAIEWFDRTLGLGPGAFEALRYKADILAVLGERRYRRGEDGEEDLAAALVCLDRALKILPNREDLLADRAGVHLALARNRRVNGRDPESEYRKAIEDGEGAAAKAPGDSRSPSIAAWAHMDLAFLAVHEGDPEPEFKASLEWFDRALAIDAKSLNDLGGSAAALHGLAGCGEERGEDTRGLLRRALELYDRALAVEPGEHRLLGDRASTKRTLARACLGLGEDPTPWYEGALADWTESLRISPGYEASRLGRADLLWDTGRIEEAIADYEVVAAANPRNTGLARCLEDSRRELRFLSEGPEWSRRAAQGRRAVRRGDYSAARAAYEAGLAALETEIAALPEAEQGAKRLDESVRGFLRVARFTLASVAVHASLGRDHPWGTGSEMEASEAARLRDEAFAHLDAAVEAGLSDPEEVRNDRDLRLLRDDPRWEALLRRLAPPK